MNEKELDRLEDRVKLVFVKELVNAMAGMLVTAEGEDEEGNLMMGRAIMVSPRLAEIVKEALGEEASEQLLRDIQAVLGKAGEEVIALIVKAVTGEDPKAVDIEEEEM